MSLPLPWTKYRYDIVPNGEAYRSTDTLEKISIAAEDTSNFKPTTSSRNIKWLPALFVLLLCAVSSALTYTVIHIAAQGETPSSHSSTTTTHATTKSKAASSPPQSPCGTTVAEAISRGCTFDALSDLWLPADCPREYNDEYVHFRNDSPWQYWADPQGQVEIFNRSEYVKVDGKGKGKGVNGTEQDRHYWSRTDDHLVHCSFMLRRLAFSLETGAPFSREADPSPYTHMAHCASALLDIAMTGTFLDNISTKTSSGIGYCEKLV